MKECVNKEVARTPMWVGVFSEGAIYLLQVLLW